MVPFLNILLKILLSIWLIIFLSGGYKFANSEGQFVWELADLSAFGVAISIFSFILLYLYRATPLPWLDSFLDKLNTLTPKHIWVLSSCVFLFYTLLLFTKHFSLNSGFDTAIFDQALFNSSRGLWHFSYIKGDVTLFKDHVQPILFAFVPLYWISPTPLWLFAAQALCAALSIILTFKLSEALKLPPLLAVLMTLALLSSPHFRGMIDNNFHPIVLSVPLLLGALYFLYRDKLILFFGCFLLYLLCKEYLPLYGLFLAFYIFFWGTCRSKRGVGISMALLSIFYFLAVKYYFSPSSGDNYVYFIERYGHLGSNFNEVVLSLINPLVVAENIFTPEKIKYLAYFFGHFGFFALFAPKALILLLPFFGQNLLTLYAPQFDMNTHYAADGIGLLVFASILGLRNCLSHQPRSGLFLDTKKATYILLFGALCFFGRSDTLSLRGYVYDLNRYQAVKELYDKISASTSISAQDPLLPHFSARNQSYLYPYKSAETTNVVLDLAAKPWPLKQPEYDAQLNALKSTKHCEAMKADEAIVICE